MLKYKTVMRLCFAEFLLCLAMHVVYAGMVFDSQRVVQTAVFSTLTFVIALIAYFFDKKGRYVYAGDAGGIEAEVESYYDGYDSYNDPQTGTDASIRGKLMIIQKIQSVVVGNPRTITAVMMMTMVQASSMMMTMIQKNSI